MTAPDKAPDAAMAADDTQNPSSIAAPASAKKEKEKEKEKDDFVELLKAMVFAAVIALSIRTFLFEPFNIPSGSMLPTLQVGDYLFVEKYAYGYSRFSFPLALIPFDGRVLESAPARGDVVVFRLPKQTDIDYIKRIIGLPGDRIQMIEGILHINDAPVSRRYLGSEQADIEGRFVLYSRYEETLPGGVTHNIYEISDEDEYDNTPVYVVPEGHYFAMGDNRDSSLDSRAGYAVGFVPAENLIGRAAILFFSTEGIGNKCGRDGMLAAVKSIGCKMAAWPTAIRYNRIFTRVSKL